MKTSVKAILGARNFQSHVRADILILIALKKHQDGISKGRLREKGMWYLYSVKDDAVKVNNASFGCYAQLNEAIEMQKRYAR